LFFPQLLQAVGGGFVPEVLDAVWDLVWSGEVTNDTLEPLRAYVNPRRRRRPRDRSWQLERIRRPGHVGSGLGLPAEASGRWSLVSGLVIGARTSTERLTARTQLLLERYGVLTREAVMAEGIEGGFTAIYGILKAMEDAGRVRRGYFVAGRGGTQFAVAGAVERLRALREPSETAEAVMVAATDPANPYGAALPWPERPQGITGRRPMRAAGTFVIMLDGALAAWLAPRDSHLVTCIEAVNSRPADETARAVALCLARGVATGRWMVLFIREIDGRPAAESPLAGALRDAGFTGTPHGFVARVSAR
jgi:ATP-dependent Lhr-like helicase